MTISQRYHVLLREAFETSERVDGYDLDSRNADSLAEWEKRLARYREAHGALIAFVIENGHELTTDCHEGFL